MYLEKRSGKQEEWVIQYYQLFSRLSLRYIYNMYKRHMGYDRILLSRINISNFKILKFIMNLK